MSSHKEVSQGCSGSSAVNTNSSNSDANENSGSSATDTANSGGANANSCSSAANTNSGSSDANANSSPLLELPVASTAEAVAKSIISDICDVLGGNNEEQPSGSNRLAGDQHEANTAAFVSQSVLSDIIDDLGQKTCCNQDCSQQGSSDDRASAVTVARSILPDNFDMRGEEGGHVEPGQLFCNRGILTGRSDTSISVAVVTRILSDIIDGLDGGGGGVDLEHPATGSQVLIFCVNTF